MIKILIVDRRIDVCDFVKYFFEARDFRGYTALNAFDALRILKKDKPQLILLDVRMTGMDGIETLKKIREIDARVKIIIITAVDDEKMVEAVRKLGVSEYLTKPLVLEELERIVLSCAKGINNA